MGIIGGRGIYNTVNLESQFFPCVIANIFPLSVLDISVVQGNRHTGVTLKQKVIASTFCIYVVAQLVRSIVDIAAHEGSVDRITVIFITEKTTIIFAITDSLIVTIVPHPIFTQMHLTVDNGRRVIRALNCPSNFLQLICAVFVLRSNSKAESFICCSIPAKLFHSC